MITKLPPSKFLVVDDDEMMLAFIKRFLVQAGATSVLLAKTGEEGLILAEKERPDMIILDVRLPGANGLNILRRLRESSATADIRVLISTGEIDFRLQSDERHGNVVISKPYTQRQLQEQIERLFRLQELASSSEPASIAA